MKYFLIFLIIFNLNSYATVQPGEAITAGLFNSILTRLGLIEERHPMGYHKDNGCKSGYTFVKLTSSNFGYCAKLMLASDGYTDFGNISRCLDDNGKPASGFEINLMLVKDINTFKTLANHSSGWKRYYIGQITTVQSDNESWGFSGIEINPDYVCGTTSSGDCYRGNTGWDYADRTDDIETAGRLICVY